MNKRDEINKLIEETLNSADHIERASPKPFLLTRIQARLNKSKANIWEKMTWLVGRPVFAIPALVIVLCVNVLVIVSNRPEPFVTEHLIPVGADEFTSSVSTIYDIENSEP